MCPGGGPRSNPKNSGGELKRRKESNHGLRRKHGNLEGLGRRTSKPQGRWCGGSAQVDLAEVPLPGPAQEGMLEDEGPAEVDKGGPVAEPLATTRFFSIFVTCEMFFSVSLLKGALDSMRSRGTRSMARCWQHLKCGGRSKRAELWAIHHGLLPGGAIYRPYGTTWSLIGGLWRGGGECIGAKQKYTDLWIKLWGPRNVRRQSGTWDVKHVKAHRTKKDKKLLPSLPLPMTKGPKHLSWKETETKTDELAKK